MRQLTAAIARLHAFGDDITHGCIGPERLLLTEDGRLVITDYIVGPALETMDWPREKFWYESRIVLPATGEPAVFDRQTDVMQIGLLTLALLESRMVYVERRYPLPLAVHVAAAREVPLEGPTQRISGALTEWLARSLQRDRISAFETVEEMLGALDRLIEGGRYDARQSAVAAFITRCREASPDLMPRVVEAPREAERPVKPAPAAPAITLSHPPAPVATRAHVPVDDHNRHEPIEFMPAIGEEAIVFDSGGSSSPAMLAGVPEQASGDADEEPGEEMNSLLDMEVFVGMVHQQKRLFVVQVNRLPLLLVDPSRRAYWVLPPQAGAEPPPVGEVVTRLRRGSLRYRDARAGDPPQDAGLPIELLLWNLGMMLEPDDLLPQVKARGWVQLTRWPDFGRIRSNPSQLKMSALLTTRAYRIDEVFDAVGEPRPQVIAFVNACALCGLLSDEQVETAAPSVAHVAREGRSLGGLMQRLRGALGIGRA